MNSFRTEVNINPAKHKIDHKSNILMIGSCFSEYMGEKLADLKFRVDINPFGIMYNPISVQKNIEILLDKKKYTKDDLVYDNGKWFSFDHHGSFSDTGQQSCLEKINYRLRVSSENLRKADILIITWGTAWSYLLLGTERIVSNCHKQPAEKFDRFRLTDQQITTSYFNLIPSLLEINPMLRIIFTVSPVRHCKNGAVENNLSKSTLILAMHRLIKEYPCCGYFPAYEIAMDDLRDYRYYADDLIHPNKQMIEYIWNKFKHTYFTQETLDINTDLNKVIAARNHKPFDQSSREHQKFLQKQIDFIQSLTEEYPFIDFSDDDKWFHEQLS